MMRQHNIWCVYVCSKTLQHVSILFRSSSGSSYILC